MPRYATWSTSLLLGLLLAVLGGCPEETGEDAGTDAGVGNDAAVGVDAAQPDAALPDSALPDTAAPDGAEPDAVAPDASMPDASDVDAASADGASAPDAVGGDAYAPAGPEPPSVVAPVAAALVGSPLRVTGQGEPGLLLTVTVLDAAVSIGTASTTVAGDGSYWVDVSYTEPAAGTALTVSAVQEDAVGASAPTDVSVVHQPSQLSGSLSQLDGDTAGTEVRVRLYASEIDIIDHLQEQILVVAEAQLVSATAFHFSVGDGSYFVRAFRDEAGPGGVGPDGQPTLSTDPQAAALGPVVIAGSDSAGNNLVLENVSHVGHYSGLQVYTFNESGWAAPPRYETAPGSDVWLDGQGVCGGYHMQLLVGAHNGPSGGLPQVRTPGRGVIELLDDGGCGAAVADNSASSYDYDADDGNFQFGWPDPDDGDAGDYLLLFRDAAANVIHIEADSVDPVLRLERSAPLTSPSGAEVGLPSSTLQWDPVPGAAFYQLYLSSGSDDLGSSGFISQTSYQPGSPLPDDSTVEVMMELYDADPTAGEYDARANSVDSRFVTDADGQDSVFISGDIVNDSGATGGYVISAVDVSGRARRSLLWLPETATEFTLATLATDQAHLDCFIDVDGSGDDESPGNASYTARLDSIDASADVSGTVVHFTHPLTLLSPAEGAAQTGATPTFTWEDYSAHAPAGGWSYMLMLEETEVEGFPPFIVAVSSATTSYDMANPPTGYEAYDAIYFFTCRQSGGTLENRTCNGGTPTPSPADLSSASLWEWSLAVVPCDLSDFGNNVDDDGNGIDDYSDCTSSMGPGLFHTWSPKVRFSTD